MAARFLRQVVSGKKDRYQQDGFDLDLVMVTDRIVIMGYPASGIEGVYRNKRSDIIDWLSKKSPEGKYRIFSLCPRCENWYSPDEFGGRVSRFPFPDHFPPPLSLYPLFTARFGGWLAQDPDNIAVIHCKAGKGRSGSMAIAYLLTQPGLPSPPSCDAQHNDDDEKPRMTLNNAPSPEEAGHLSATDRLPFLINYHSSRRMAPSTSGNMRTGVSIASQRRFLKYYASILDGQDKRSSEQRLVTIKRVRVLGTGLKGVAKTIMGGNIAIRVGRYKDTIVKALDDREKALSKNASSEQSWNDDHWDDRDDMLICSGEMRQSEHLDRGEPYEADLHEFSQSGEDTDATTDGDSTPPTAGTHAITKAKESHEQLATSKLTDDNTHNVRILVPAKSFAPADAGSSNKALEGAAAKKEAINRGLVIDAEREVQLRFLIGRTGGKHGSLPVMASLGIIWFVPCFEEEANHSGGTLVVPAKEIDFLKPASGIERVEIEWEQLQ